MNTETERRIKLIEQTLAYCATQDAEWNDVTRLLHSEIPFLIKELKRLQLDTDVGSLDYIFNDKQTEVDPEDRIDPRTLSKEEMNEATTILRNLSHWKPKHVLYLFARRRMLDRIAYQGKVEALILAHAWADKEWREANPHKPLEAVPKSKEPVPEFKP